MVIMLRPVMHEESGLLATVDTTVRCSLAHGLHFTDSSTAMTTQHAKQWVLSAEALVQVDWGLDGRICHQRPHCDLLPHLWRGLWHLGSHLQPCSQCPPVLCVCQVLPGELGPVHCIPIQRKPDTSNQRRNCLGIAISSAIWERPCQIATAVASTATLSGSSAQHARKGSGKL
jgi:hypothetical protein